MKALISPSEKVIYTEERTHTVTDPQTNEETTEVYIHSEEIPNAVRIAQVEETEFDVGGDLYWIDCANTVKPSTHYYDTSDSTVKVLNDYTPS